MLSPSLSYQCPLCSHKLKLIDRCFKCGNNHQFDMAKEGYVNLVPANKKRSKNPGDNIDMMQARRRFLVSGHYSQLGERVTELGKQFIGSSQQQVLDIGCGEGYYTNMLYLGLAKSLAEHEQSSPLVYGLDISKVAIRYAAKKYPSCHFSVASSLHLPFADNSINLMLRIYAPCNPQELKRTMATGGALITVTPASHHLYQLKDLIYPEVRLHDETPEQLEGFTISHQEKLSYSMQLSGEESLDLLQMTPFFWHAKSEVKDQLAQADNFLCDADFLIRIYTKA